MMWVQAVVLILLAALMADAGEQPKFVLERSLTEIDEGADGTALPFIVVEYSYEGALATGWSLETDLNADGVMDRRSVSTLNYDSTGHLTRDVNESYDIATGVLEARGIITYAYDSSGNRIGNRIETDSNADGVLDYISNTTFWYDAGGNLGGWTNKVDSNADGTWDSREIAIREYDGRGNLVQAVRVIANAADGEIGKRETWRYTVDSGDKVRASEHDIDFYGDGLVDYSDRTEYTYDRRGRLSASITEYRAMFEEGDVERSLSRSTYFYDSHGNQIRVVQEDDADADGVIDQIRTTTRTYTRVHR
ncbi:MAG TPA: hypothetical protein VJ063_09595 [Verrucomicrobiae bacterium]|nr:hypothetical protein [Verrucomicrobiae bacterium]